MYRMRYLRRRMLTPTSVQLTREQESRMLAEQINLLEFQLNTIRKRLEETPKESSTQRFQQYRFKRSMRPILSILIPKIDSSRCVGCGVCVNACPTGVLALVGGKSRVVHAEACVRCGVCSNLCPSHAITI